MWLTSPDLKRKKQLPPTPDVILKQTYSDPVNTDVPKKTLDNAKVQSSPSTNLSVSSTSKQTEVCEESVCPKSVGREAATWKQNTPVATLFKLF